MSELHYKGRGEHSVNNLEQIIESLTRELAQANAKADMWKATCKGALQAEQKLTIATEALESVAMDNKKECDRLRARAKELHELVNDSLSLTNLRVRSTVNKEIAITLSDEWMNRAKKLLGDVVKQECCCNNCGVAFSDLYDPKHEDSTYLTPEDIWYCSEACYEEVEGVKKEIY